MNIVPSKLFATISCLVKFVVDDDKTQNSSLHFQTNHGTAHRFEAANAKPHDRVIHLGNHDLGTLGSTEQVRWLS